MKRFPTCLHCLNAYYTLYSLKLELNLSVFKEIPSAGNVGSNFRARFGVERHYLSLIHLSAELNEMQFQREEQHLVWIGRTTMLWTWEIYNMCQCWHHTMFCLSQRQRQINQKRRKCALRGCHQDNNVNQGIHNTDHIGSVHKASQTPFFTCFVFQGGRKFLSAVLSIFGKCKHQLEFRIIKV